MKTEYMVLTCNYGMDCRLRLPDATTKNVSGVSKIILDNFICVGWKITGHLKRENGFEEWSLMKVSE